MTLVRPPADNCRASVSTPKTFGVRRMELAGAKRHRRQAGRRARWRERIKRPTKLPLVDGIRPGFRSLVRSCERSVSASSLCSPEI